MDPRERDAAESKLRVYEVLDAAIARREQIFELVSTSADPDEAEERIRDLLDVREAGISRAVLDLQVFRLTRSEREKISARTEELRRLLRHEAGILLRVVDQVGPVLDDEVRHRLGRRYGSVVGPWFDALPARLQDLSERWQLDLGPLVRRGTVSVVLTCRAPGATPAILKLSPDHGRIAAEARALAAWRTFHVPAVIASDAGQGALLLEAIHPGTALDQSGHLPTIAALATLVHALHEHAPPPSWARPVEERIASLYRSGAANYIRRPDLQDVVPRSLYESGRRAADALAAQTDRWVVLHGDLTPANVLDGGAGRGLVAVDPTPCWGDPAFDTVDLLMWKADDLATLTARAQGVADRLGLSQDRPLRWCAAFAAMMALEHAEEARPAEPPSAHLRMLVELARLT